MNGWAPKLRRSLAAAALVACAGAVALPVAPGNADTGYHHYPYTCINGAFIPRGGPQPIQVEIAIPKTVRVGERIAVDWTMTASPLVSSNHFPAGGRLSATATVDVGGLWQGKLDSTGTKEQAELQPGGRLEMPTAISGSVSTTKEGKLYIIPRLLTLTFTPPASTVRVNDSDAAPHNGDPHQHGPIVYKGNWFYAGDRAQYGDYENDLHATKDQNDTAEVKFLGNRIKYIGERVETVGKVAVYVDGVRESVDIDAEDPAPQDKPKAQQVLWSKDLPYGDHTVKFQNLAEPGTHMAVDAFEFTTTELASPPSMFSAVCYYEGEPATVTVDVLPAANGGSNGGNDGNSSGNQHISDGDDSARGVIVLSGGGSGHGAPTETASPTPKASKTSKARSTPQVRVTPRGGAHTGEAPEQDPRPGAFIAYGSVLLLGSVAGGLVLRRRRGRAA
ncbi:hypothetical protein ABZT47_39070 [Sphaerisporangium sp. NPDC005289]|uniref:hypothetical protein n=1 Tax=Sphaerisporangium sp. NPDC005289 TaxID=3155247 RepID=UPI0033A4A340